MKIRLIMLMVQLILIKNLFSMHVAFKDFGSEQNEVASCQKRLDSLLLKESFAGNVERVVALLEKKS